MKKAKKEDVLLGDFDTERTLLYNKKDDKVTKKEFYSNLFGLFIYIIIFVITIPHVLLRNKLYLITTLYFSNLDMIATVLGFSGGPYEIWKYLYNPTTVTLFGFLSSSLINYLALIGVGFVCIRYAALKKKIFGGLSMLLIIIPITYLLPGNIIVYIMNEVAKYLYSNNISYYLRWVVTVIIGFITVVGIIGFERIITLTLSPKLEKILVKIYKYYK